jgi:hypothetical protein
MGSAIERRLGVDQRRELVTTMTDEDRVRIRAEAMATLDRLRDLAPAEDNPRRAGWSRPPPEPPKPERGLDTMNPALAAYIDQRIEQWLAHERMRTVEVVGQALGQVLNAERAEAKRDLAGQLAELRLELAKVANVLAEVRIASATEQSRTALDLPKPLARRTTVN